MREFLRKWKKYFVFSAFLSLFINFLGLTFTFYMYTIYDVICTGFSKTSLYTITIIATYALIFLVLFSYLRQRLLSAAGLDLEKTLSDPTLKNTIKLLSGPAKNVYTRGLQDIKILRDYFSHQGMFALFDAPWSPFYLMLIFFVHKVIGIVAAAGTFLIFILSILQEKLCQDLIIEANKANFRNSRFEESIFINSEAILSMSMTKAVVSRWRKKESEVILKQTIASKRAGIIQAIFKGLQILLPVSVFGLGAYYVIRHEISPGFIIVASILEGQASKPLIEFMHSYKQSISAWEAYSRLHRFLFLWEKFSKRPSLSLPKPKGQLSVSNVYFSAGERFILKNISFFLKEGEFLGIVGPSGAGKTTLSKIICGIWPPSFGEVKIDGMSISFWDKEELGNYIGYLPQEIVLFPGTVAENIAGFRKIDEKRIEEIIEELDLSFIKELPDYYRTYIDPKMLSGGQKQKIAFARAIYNRPSILILDEPNSNLDEEGEKKLISYLLKLKQKRQTTCIIITHTAKLLSVVDKILILRDGVSVGFGPRDIILKKIFALEKTAKKEAAHA